LFGNKNIDNGDWNGKQFLTLVVENEVLFLSSKVFSPYFYLFSCHTLV